LRNENLKEFQMVTETSGGAAGADDLLPLGEIAQLRGLTPSQITNRVKAWTAAGAITSIKRGRQRLVRLSDFDRLVAESAGNWQLAGWRTRRSMALNGDGESLTALQKRKAAAEIELRVLEIGKRRGVLVPLAGPQGVETAARQAGGAVLRSLDTIPGHADDLARAAKSGGAPAVRVALKKMVKELRAAAAKAMTELASIGQAAEAAGEVSVGVDLDEASDEARAEKEESRD
jgi:hypothetical protein